jgi:hypothetical protein
MNYFAKLTILASLLFPAASFAVGSGGHSLGVGVGLASTSQKDLDSLSDSVNALGGGRNSSKVSSALEFEANYQYRFSGTMWAMQFRPSYFNQTGSGSTDTVKLTGLTFFPMLRMYPLENNFIHFYMQLGVGYGQLSGSITQPGVSIDFSGSAFGALVGLGAEFCFTPSQCMEFEGNFRYLPIDRNLATNSTGTATGGITQSAKGSELELGGADLETSMSGIIGTIAYRFNF